MNFNFTEEQEQLRRTARDLFSKQATKTVVREMENDPQGYSPALWKRIADLGWLGLPFAAKYGGADGMFLDLAVILEEVGRFIAPVPIFSDIVLGGLPLAQFGSEKQKQEFLPGVAAGKTMLTSAILEPESSWKPEGLALKAKESDGAYRLDGVKVFVDNAHLATHMLVAARTSGRGADGVTVFIVDASAPGVTITPLKPMGLERTSEVAFKNVLVPANRVLGKVGQGWPIVERTLQWAVAGQCVMSVGGAAAVLEMAVEYAKNRVQFGQPIAKFQAIQHHAANLYQDAEMMRLIAYEVAWLVSEGRPCAEEIAMAKVFVSTAYTRMTRTGIQIYGGIGLSKETDPQLYFRRAKAWEPLFGTPDAARVVIGETLSVGA
ncbi:MAG: acyl-CoA/acyl-ACP dehydrogenase [Chloroflexi bacterium]|nr:acyl-CoA/acyl-ACP dehydrogenase [Chloroflexota bacterium]